MLLTLWVIAVMIGAPVALAIAGHVATRRPSVGFAVAVALCMYARMRADAPFAILDVSLPFVGKLVAGAFAVAGGWVALAALTGSMRDRRELHTLPVARVR